MLEKEMLSKLLITMTSDIESNKKKILNHFGNINIRDEENQSLLHIFVDNKYNEENCFLVIKTLLEMGLSPNSESDFKYNFIQTALYAGYSEEFILKIVEEAFKYSLYVNHQDLDKDTVIHTAIYSDDYLGKIDNLLKIYISHGFDIDLICGEARNIIEAMESEYKKYTEEDINSVKAIYEERKKVIKERNKELYNTPKQNQLKNSSNVNNNEIREIKEQKQQPIVQKNIERKPVNYQLIEELEQYGEVLNYKKFNSCPTIGREEEVMRLMVALAKDTTSPILIGESGVGKTAIANEIAYRISSGLVPKFLKDKIVLEINPETIASNTKYTGEFEAKVLKLMKLVKENDVILLINEIHTIYGIGTSENNDRDLASILKKYLDKGTLKIIGTTTKKEYDKYFSKDALKRRFDMILIEEPKDELIYTIIKKVIIDYTVKKSIPIKDENTLEKIIEALIEVTKEKNRKFDDKLCNPALSISIIDQAFAFALVFEDEYIEEHHFVKAIEWCERIYKTSKEKALIKLNDKKENITQGTRILQFKK